MTITPETLARWRALYPKVLADTVEQLQHERDRLVLNLKSREEIALNEIARLRADLERVTRDRDAWAETATVLRRERDRLAARVRELEGAASVASADRGPVADLERLALTDDIVAGCLALERQGVSREAVLTHAVVYLGAERERLRRLLERKLSLAIEPRIVMVDVPPLDPPPLFHTADCPGPAPGCCKGTPSPPTGAGKEDDRG